MQARKVTRERTHMDSGKGQEKKAPTRKLTVCLSSGQYSDRCHPMILSISYFFMVEYIVQAMKFPSRRPAPISLYSNGKLENFF